MTLEQMKHTRRVYCITIIGVLLVSGTIGFNAWWQQATRSELRRTVVAAGGEIYFEQSLLSKYLPNAICEWLPTAISESNSKIRTLKLREMAVPPSALPLAAGFEVRHLDLSGSDIVDDDMIYVMTMKHLETLDLGETKVGSLGLSELESLRYLQELDLRGTLVADDVMESIAHLKDLKVLILPPTISDDGLKTLIGRLPNLEVLFVDQCDLTEQTFIMLSELPRLQVISTSGCPNISDATQAVVEKKLFKRWDE